MLDFRIQTFLTVCSCMNFTKAADKLHITQPAVSQHIRYLEELYHTKLFSYQGKKMELTHSGQLLLSTVTTLKNDENLMIQLMNTTKNEDFPLQFGATMTIGEFVLANRLGHYISAHPNANIRMLIANTTELLHKLQQGEIHFAIVEGYFDAAEYDSMIFSTESFISVCSARHNFTKMPSRLCDLIKERLLVREPGSGTRDILEKNLDIKNMHITNFHQVAEISSMHVILDLVKQDCGITFLYRTAVEKELQEGILREIPLSDFKMEHDFTFIWNKNSIYADTYRQICLELQA